MRPEPLSLVVFTALLKVELSTVEDSAVRAAINATSIPPYPRHLILSAGKKDVYVAWVFAQSRDQLQGAVYCDRGPDHRKRQWGLIDLKSEFIDANTPWFVGINDLYAAW